MSLATKSCDAWKQVAVEEPPEIRHRMALLPGGATKQWLGLVLNFRYLHEADIAIGLGDVRNCP
jgi:hypothetical protein